MLFAITLAAIVLLQVVSNYTFIHILLGTATVWVLAKLASKELRKVHACY